MGSGRLGYISGHNYINDFWSTNVVVHVRNGRPLKRRRAVIIKTLVLSEPAGQSTADTARSIKSVGPLGLHAVAHSPVKKPLISWTAECQLICMLPGEKALSMSSLFSFVPTFNGPLITSKHLL